MSAYRKRRYDQALRIVMRRTGSVALALAIALSGCTNGGGGPVLAPLAPTRLVMATRGSTNQVQISMSGDGQVWTEPSTVTANGAAVQTVATPSIFNDGTLYDLIWLDPTGAVRFATSRDTTAWAVQSSPLTTLSPGAQPAFVQQPGRYLAAFNSGGTVSVVDLANTAGARATVTQGAIGPVTMANAGNRLVLASIGTDHGIHVFTSPDGSAWSAAGTVSAATLGEGQAYYVAVGWGEGRFVLATRSNLGGDPIPVVRCKLFESTDALTWTEDPAFACSNSSTGMLPARFGGHTLLYENFNNQILRVSVDAAAFGDMPILGFLGAPSVTTGGGPQLAWLNLNQVSVTSGSSQNVTLVTLGFTARIGVPGSAKVVWPPWKSADLDHQLDNFGRVSAGGSTVVPPHDSPYAWVVQPATNLTQANGQLAFFLM